MCLPEDTRKQQATQKGTSLIDIEWQIPNLSVMESDIKGETATSASTLLYSSRYITKAVSRLYKVFCMHE